MISLSLEAQDVVVLRFHQPYGPDDEAAYLDALEHLARIEQPYVLLAIFGGGPHLSQAGEKGQALWFKRTRAQMEARCRACAMVRPGASDVSAQVFRRLWSFPFFASPSEAEARAFLTAYRPSLGSPKANS
ncbi:hypothetical protein [Azorhizobium sp. AG788]|uniref:hypothetical protein n=1 Tax=Azorhizobium sp. AG788 TaxID=2183897 RepID=UPI003139C366